MVIGGMFKILADANDVQSTACELWLKTKVQFLHDCPEQGIHTNFSLTTARQD